MDPPRLIRLRAEIDALIAQYGHRDAFQEIRLLLAPLPDSETRQELVRYAAEKLGLPT